MFRGSGLEQNQCPKRLSLRCLSHLVSYFVLPASPLRRPLHPLLRLHHQFLLVRPRGKGDECSLWGRARKYQQHWLFVKLFSTHLENLHWIPLEVLAYNFTLSIFSTLPDGLNALGLEQFDLLLELGSLFFKPSTLARLDRCSVFSLLQIVEIMEVFLFQRLVVGHSILHRLGQDFGVLGFFFF